MAVHNYQQQRGTTAVAGENGRFEGSVSTLARPDVTQATVTIDTDTDALSRPTDEAEVLINAGIIPVGLPVAARTAVNLEFDGDNTEGLFYIYEDSNDPVIVEGYQGDVRREAIGDLDTLVTFHDESGNRFERDDYVACRSVIITHSGAPVHLEADPEGIEDSLAYLAFESEMGADYARAHQTLRCLNDSGVVGDVDLHHAIGHLVSLHDEVESGADMGEWSTPRGRRALRSAFAALTDALPVEFIRDFGEREHGRSVEDTDALLRDPDANPFV